MKALLTATNRLRLGNVHQSVEASLRSRECLRDVRSGEKRKSNPVPPGPINGKTLKTRGEDGIGIILGLCSVSARTR